ncbi:MAG: hypothetical protein QG611_679 [Bacteroidota bacterium]|nr:hypothetical protein [Bacteroidota bacterium]
MERKIYILLFVLLLVLNGTVFGQKVVVIVEPDAGLDVGALNQAILNHPDPGNAIFELKRGGIYYVDGTISHTGYHLHVRAEAGEGPRPILIPAVDINGVSARTFAPGDDATFEGIHFFGEDELGNKISGQVYTTGNGIRIVFNDCIFEGDDTALSRVSSTNTTFILKNSVRRNAIRLGSSNGRGIDFRTGPQDTLWVENCTFYNLTGYHIRFGDQFLKYFYYNHNTAWNSQRQYLEFERVVNATYKNSIFYDCGIWGEEPAPHPDTLAAWEQRGRLPWEPGHVINVDSLGTFVLNPEITISDADRKLEVKNILWGFNPEYRGLFEKYDTVRRLITLENPVTRRVAAFIEAGILDTSNIFEEELAFTNQPPLVLEYLEAFFSNNMGLDPSAPVPPFEAREDWTNPAWKEQDEGGYSFGYSNNTRAATAAEGGVPLGDPRWKNVNTSSENVYRLKEKISVNAYPNPFNSYITFNFGLDEPAKVSISIYNILGQNVLTLNERQIQPGTNLDVDFSQIDSKGIFFYNVAFKKMNGVKVNSSGRLLKQ